MRIGLWPANTLQVRALIALSAFLLATRRLPAQPAACRERTETSIGTNRQNVQISAPLRDRSDSSDAVFFKQRFSITSIQSDLMQLPVDGRQPAWARLDLGMLALRLGSQEPSYTRLDSIVTLVDRRQLFISVGCIRPIGEVEIGSYHLDLQGAQFNRKLVTPLNRALEAIPPLRIGVSNVYPLPGAIYNEEQVARDLAVMDSIRAELRLPSTRAFDIVIVPAGDSTLRALGIDTWVDPVSEVTILLGPLVVSASERNGGISLHELIHVLLLRQPMHWMLQEGFPTLLAGARGAAFTEGVCLYRATLEERTFDELQMLLRGTFIRPIRDVELAFLGGVLAKVVRSRYSDDWLLSRTPVEKLASEWQSEIARTVSECPR